MNRPRPLIASLKPTAYGDRIRAGSKTPMPAIAMVGMRAACRCQYPV